MGIWTKQPAQLGIWTMNKPNGTTHKGAKTKKSHHNFDFEDDLKTDGDLELQEEDRERAK